MFNQKLKKMLIKDLPGDTNLRGVKIKTPMPVELIEDATELYLFAILWGIVFVSIDPPESEVVQMFPTNAYPSDILNWEIA